MNRDPLDLLEKPDVPSASGGTWTTLILGLLIGIAGFAIYERFKDAPDDRQDDRQEQQDKDKDKGKDKDKDQVAATGSWVLVIEETGDRARYPHLAKIQNDLDFWDSLKARGIEWTWYDSDSPNISEYLPDAKAAGLPALLVVSPTGKVLAAKSVPPTVDAVREIINEVLK